MNYCLGYRKASPITMESKRTVFVSSTCVDMLNNNNTIGIRIYWWDQFKLTLPTGLILDRHYLNNIDTLIPFKNSNENENETEEQKYIVNVRKIPVALLRRFFLRNPQWILKCIDYQTDISIDKMKIIMKEDESFIESSMSEEERIEIEYAIDGGDNDFNIYSNKCRFYIMKIIDLVFCSFEKCLNHFIGHLSRGIDDWPLCGLENSINDNNYWKGMKKPEYTKGKLKPNIKDNHIIWFLCIWRMNASLLLETEFLNHIPYYINASSINEDHRNRIRRRRRRRIYLDKKNKIIEKGLENEYGDNFPSQNQGGYNANVNANMDDKEYIKINDYEVDCQTKELLYQTKLYRNTHLDIMSMMQYKDIFDDCSLMVSGMLRKYYPACYQVCCLGELPNMTGIILLMNHRYDIGAKREASDNMYDAIRHIFFVKGTNRICMVRNISSMLIVYATQYPIILELFRLVLKCVLLGNLPISYNSLDFMASVRINVLNNPEIQNTTILDKTDDLEGFNDDINEEEEDDDADGKGKGKKKKKKKKKKTPYKPGIFSVSDIKLFEWIKQNKYLTLLVLREYLLATLEEDEIENYVLDQNLSWDIFKKISIMGLAAAREELSKQCHVHPEKFDWSKIEHKVSKDSGGGGNSSNTNTNTSGKEGVIIDYFRLARKFSVKLRKGTFETLLLKKMRACEDKLDTTRLFQLFKDPNFQFHADMFDVFDKRSNIINEYPMTTTSASNDLTNNTTTTLLSKFNKKPKWSLTLEDFHFICWTVAYRSSPVLETKWLWLLGMTEDGINKIRDWIFGYYIYDDPDNALIKKAESLYNSHPMDYFILKNYLKTVRFYSANDRISIPYSDSVHQILAIRESFKLDPWDHTPEKAGFGLLCPGCNKWGCKLKDHTHSFEDRRRRNKCTSSLNYKYYKQQQQQQQNLSISSITTIPKIIEPSFNNNVNLDIGAYGDDDDDDVSENDNHNHMLSPSSLNSEESNENLENILLDQFVKSIKPGINNNNNASNTLINKDVLISSSTNSNITNTSILNLKQHKIIKSKRMKRIKNRLSKIKTPLMASQLTPNSLRSGSNGYFSAALYNPTSENGDELYCKRGNEKKSYKFIDARKLYMDDTDGEYVFGNGNGNDDKTRMRSESIDNNKDSKSIANLFDGFNEYGFSKSNIKECEDNQIITENNLMDQIYESNQNTPTTKKIDNKEEESLIVNYVDEKTFMKIKAKHPSYGNTMDLIKKKKKKKKTKKRNNGYLIDGNEDDDDDDDGDDTNSDDDDDEISEEEYAKNDIVGISDDIGIIDNVKKYENIKIPKIHTYIKKNGQMRVTVCDTSMFSSFNINNTNKQQKINKIDTLHKSMESKIPLTTLTRLIFNKEHNCNKKLLYIDLVGQIIRVKDVEYARCIHCGVLMRCQNKNFTFGPSCGDHVTCYHSLDHTVWNIDRSIPPEMKTRRNAILRNICWNDIKYNNMMLSPGNITINIANNTIGIAHHNNPTPRRIVDMLDYRDIIDLNTTNVTTSVTNITNNYSYAFSSSSSYYELENCRWCTIIDKNHNKGFALIPVYNCMFKVMKIPICKKHLKMIRCEYLKRAFIPIQEVDTFINKNYVYNYNGGGSSSSSSNSNNNSINTNNSNNKKQSFSSNFKIKRK